MHFREDAVMVFRYNEKGSRWMYLRNLRNPKGGWGSFLEEAPALVIWLLAVEGNSRLKLVITSWKSGLTKCP